MTKRGQKVAVPDLVRGFYTAVNEQAARYHLDYLNRNRENYSALELEYLNTLAALRWSYQECAWSSVVTAAADLERQGHWTRALEILHWSIEAARHVLKEIIASLNQIDRNSIAETHLYDEELIGDGP